MEEEEEEFKLKILSIRKWDFDSDLILVWFDPIQFKLILRFGLEKKDRNHLLTCLSNNQ